MGFFICKKKNNKRRFEVLSTFNSILSDKKVSPIESNFIKEVIDKKSFFFVLVSFDCSVAFSVC